MAKLLVLNLTTSASAGLTRIDISKTTYLISCKPILPSRQLYIMKTTKDEVSTTAAMTNMKATETTTMTLMNWQKRKKRLGVSGTVVLIVIQKK